MISKEQYELEKDLLDDNDDGLPDSDVAKKLKDYADEKGIKEETYDDLDIDYKDPNAVEESLANLSEEIDLSLKEIKTNEEWDEIVGEVNLYQDVCELFKKYGHPDPEVWVKGRIDENLFKDYPMSAQRLIANRALRLMFADIDADTRDVRFLLLDNGSYEDWKELAAQVVEYLVENYKENNPTQER